jgi:YgiT-type zinc finger domain-containing protein
MHREYVTYFTWLGDELITVPDFPAWMCDVCGRREYDVHALNQLSLLLAPNAGHPSPRPPRPHPPRIPKGQPRPSRNRD